MDNADREFFRNNPRAAYVDKMYPGGPFRLYRPKPLTGPSLANHLVSGGASALWVINEYFGPALRAAHGGRSVFLARLIGPGTGCRSRKRRSPPSALW
jgi:hypothetical protein